MSTTAQPTTRTSSDQRLGAVAHLAGVFGPAPAIALFFSLRDDRESPVEQLRLALNWQLTVAVASVAALLAQVALQSLAFGAGAFGITSALAWLWLLPWAIGAAFSIHVGVGVLIERQRRYPWSIPFTGSRSAELRQGTRRVDPEGVIPLAALALGAGLLIAPLGVVLAHLARARLRRTGEEGWGVATAGLAIGYAGLGLAALLVVVIGLSGLLLAPLGR